MSEKEPIKYGAIGVWRMRTCAAQFLKIYANAKSHMHVDVPYTWHETHPNERQTKIGKSIGEYSTDPTYNCTQRPSRTRSLPIFAESVRNIDMSMVRKTILPLRSNNDAERRRRKLPRVVDDRRKYRPARKVKNAKSSQRQSKEIQSRAHSRVRVVYYTHLKRAYNCKSA